MSDQQATTGETVALSLTRDEAQVVVDALRCLVNTRRYAFKDDKVDINEVHRSMFDAAERIATAIRQQVSNS
jgi:hypothetical protein